MEITKSVGCLGILLLILTMTVRIMLWGFEVIPLITGFILVILIIVTGFLPVPISADDILQALDRATWKTGREIREEIVRIKKVAQWRMEYFTDPGKIYPLLASLEEQGFIESRKRIKEAPWGEIELFEYRLKEDGIRRKIDIEKRLHGYNLPRDLATET